MMRLGLNPGAAVEAATLARGVGAPGDYDQVGIVLPLLSCLIGDGSRLRVRVSSWGLNRAARWLSPEGFESCFCSFPCNFFRINW
jgi:hypothetical protein